MKPTALILCGLPYSGTSSIAAALENDGFELICLLTINEERGLGVDGAAVTGPEWLRTHQIALDRMRTLIAKGESVVWDDTNYAAWIRDPIFDAAEEAGAQPLVVFVDTPLEEVQARAASRGHASMPREDFDRAVRDFERPCCALRIDGAMKTEQAVALIRKALRREPVPNA